MSETFLTSASTELLLAFWDETRLRAQDARSTSSVGRVGDPLSWREALEHVLRVGYGRETRCRAGATGWLWEQRFTAPSAGALYPFEVLALVPGETPGVFLHDPERGRLGALEVPALTTAELATLGLRAPAAQRFDALLVVLARPWRSMKKYRRRGYAYCHLDVGHTAVNLALYAAALGSPPTLHLRFDRVALTRRLGLEGLCREPLVVLGFSTPTAVAPAPGARPETMPESVALMPPDGDETANWDSLRGLLSLDQPQAAATLPVPVSAAAKPACHVGRGAIQALPAPPPALVSAWEWRAAIVGRRSAKGFRPEPLELSRLGALLAAIRTAELPLDAGDAPGVGLRLVVRDVGGLCGVHVYRADEHALEAIGAASLDDSFVAACMQQELAASAAALIVLHAPIRPLLDQRGYSAFAELHFQAAHLAQRLCLAAGRWGVGATCIGGFDDVHCARLARLAGDEEAIYVIALGIADDDAIKFDRAAIAASHGYDE